MKKIKAAFPKNIVQNKNIYSSFNQGLRLNNLDK